MNTINDLDMSVDKSEELPLDLARSDMAREIDDYSRRIEMVACDVQDGSNRLGQSRRSGSTRPTPDLPNPGRR